MTNVVKIISTQQVLVKEVSTNLIKVTAPASPTVIKIVTAGPQGASALIVGYSYSQSVAAQTWTINHNLGYRPSVEIIDEAGREIEGDVFHATINQVVIVFTVAVAGSARLV